MSWFAHAVARSVKPAICPRTVKLVELEEIRKPKLKIARMEPIQIRFNQLRSRSLFTSLRSYRSVFLKSSKYILPHFADYFISLYRNDRKKAGYPALFLSFTKGKMLPAVRRDHSCIVYPFKMSWIEDAILAETSPHLFDAMILMRFYPISEFFKNLGQQ